MEHSLKLIGIAFILLLAGAVLPFLMLVGVFESTLFLNLVAVVCTIAGATTGFIGMAFYMRRRR